MKMVWHQTIRHDADQSFFLSRFRLDRKKLAIQVTDWFYVIEYRHTIDKPFIVPSIKRYLTLINSTIIDMIKFAVCKY
jgi:hypothetical protein